MVIGEAAGLDDEAALGNFIADAVKGRRVESVWGARIGLGIRFHRELDHTSDAHESSEAARGILRGRCGKWSGAVWDVLVDHVLACEFQALAPGCGSLEMFTGHQINRLRNHKRTMPQRSALFFDAMCRHNWLIGYREGEVVENVLQAMSTRRLQAEPLSMGWKAFLDHEGDLRELANTLMGDMMLWGKGCKRLSLTHQPSAESF